MTSSVILIELQGNYRRVAAPWEPNGARITLDMPHTSKKPCKGSMPFVHT